MSRPRVAVVIPCHDDRDLVEQAVASVRETEPVEIVVVDDGSTDSATLERLDALRAAGTRVVRQANGGPGAARTNGLDSTAAPYVFPLDADDLLAEGALAAMADALDARPELSFAWGDYELFGSGRGRYRSPDVWLPWTLTYVNPYPVCSLFRREALVAAGGWRGRAYEDWDLWLRLAAMGRTGARVDRTVYRRRLHDQPRVLTADRRRHQQLYARIQTDNASLFGRRGALRRAERPAAWKRLAYPVVFGARRVIPIRIEALMQRTMMRLGTGLPG